MSCISLVAYYYCPVMTTIVFAKGPVTNSYIILYSHCQESTLKGLTVLTWVCTICSLPPGHYMRLEPGGLHWVKHLHTDEQEQREGLGPLCTHTHLLKYKTMHTQTVLTSCTSSPPATHPVRDITCKYRTGAHMHSYTEKGVPTFTDTDTHTHTINIWVIVEDCHFLWTLQVCDRGMLPHEREL